MISKKTDDSDKLNDSKENGAYPPNMWYGHGFSVLNSVSFTLISGASILLYFKRLGASVTILGIVAAMEFIFQALQIPSTRLLEKVGWYRKFVLRGWGTRAIFTALMAGIAIYPGLEPPSLRMGLMLFALFAFQFSRGISSCAFLPWITHLLPEKTRSRYIVFDRIFIQGPSLLTTLAATFYLSAYGKASDFAPLFVISFIFNISTLLFIRRMPEARVDPSFESAEGVPWRAILNYPAFKSFIMLNLLICMAFGAGVFWIPFLKDVHHVSDSTILMMSVCHSMTGVLILLILNRMIDRVRHSLVFEIGILAMFLQYFSWFLITLGILPPILPVLGLQAALAGTASSIYLSISLRMLMSIVPQMGRTHFFAIFNSMFNVTMGMMPLLWGPMLDLLKNWQGSFGPLQLQYNAYTFLYAVLFITVLIALFFGPNVEEKYPMTTRLLMRELFVRTPTRALGWLWNRRPDSGM